MSVSARPLAADAAGLGRSELLAGCGLFLLAVLLRLPGLWTPPEFDELYHLLAARSWAESGELRIAEGLYTRAATFTIAVGSLFRLFGESLAVARIPTLLSGALAVVLLYVWLRASGCRTAAWLAALLLAVSPQAVQLSTFIRFYAPHQLLVLGGAAALFLAVTGRGDRHALTAGLVSAACFAAAAALQVTTLIALAGAGAWTVLWFARHRLALALRSRRGTFVLAGMAAALMLAAALALTATPLAGVLESYRFTALWNGAERDAPAFYHKFLVGQYPLLWPLTGVLALAAAVHRPALAGFCAVLFAVGFTAHSFAGMKHDRYLFWCMPYLFVLWAVGLERLGPAAAARLGQLSAQAVRVYRLAPAGGQMPATLLATASAVVLIATQPGLTLGTVKAPGHPEPAHLIRDWQRSATAIRTAQSGVDVVVTTNELYSLYVVGDYGLLLSRSRKSEIRGEGEYLRDWRTGRPVLDSASALVQVIACFRRGLIVLHESYWNTPFRAEPAVWPLILERTQRLSVPAPGIQLQRWEDGGAEAETPRCAAVRSLLAGQGSGRVAEGRAGPARGLGE